MRRSKIAHFLMLLSLLAAAEPVAAAETPALTTVDFPGASLTVVNGINRYGPLLRSAEMVGNYTDLAGNHGFLLSAGHVTTLDVPHPLKPFPFYTTAYGINGNHQVVGVHQDPVDGGLFSFLYYGGRYTSVAQCSPTD